MPFDLHVHTKESSPCAQVGAEEMVKMYAKKGFGGFFVTDHLSPYSIGKLGAPDGEYTHVNISWEALIDKLILGYETARQAGDKIGFRVMLGVELTIVSGLEDYLILGITKNFLLEHPNLHTYSLKKLHSVLNKNRLALVQAHPLRDYLRLMPQKNLDGIEVYNGNQGHNSHNPIAMAEAKSRNCLMYSGSDAHSKSHICRGGMWLPANIGDGFHMARYIIENNNKIELITT